MTELYGDQCSAPQGGRERTGELDILGVGRPVLTAKLLEHFAPSNGFKKCQQNAACLSRFFIALCSLKQQCRFRCNRKQIKSTALLEGKERNGELNIGIGNADLGI